MKTTIAKKIEKTEGEANYDQNAKRLLAEKIILAHILTGTCPEFKDMNPKDVMPLIEGQPKVAKKPVLPDDIQPEITGSNTEYFESETGVNTYDVKFYVWTPDKSELIEEQIKLIVDVEAQNIDKPGYSITKRGIFYGARMISAQSGKEFTNSQYDKIKKVYSIWILFGVPKKDENTITRYSITEDTVIGNVTDKKLNYDLLNVIQIRLGKNVLQDTDKQSQILRFLGVIFSNQMEADEKEDILSHEYDVDMSTSIKRRLDDMCNISYGIRNDGVEEG